MNNNIRTIFLVILSLLLALPAVALANDSGDGVWQISDAAALRMRPEKRTVEPKAFGTFRLNAETLRSLLKSAPVEYTSDAVEREVVLSLPMPDGSYARFRIERSPVAEQGLIDKFPELGETFRGRGIDDPTATARFDFLPSGFHSMILSTRGTVLVDPYFAKGDVENYIAYMKADAPRLTDFHCDFREDKSLADILDPNGMLDESLIPEHAAPEVTSGTQMRTYRLALAATNEYAVAVGTNTIAGTLAAQVLIMNRVNGVYERDLAIHMNIIATNNLIVYAGDQTCAGVACTSTNDPYTNNNGSTMLGENTTNINTVIGTANYDIGHVFSTGGGGVATLNGPCGGNKARGVTGLSNPVGDAFAIDYVAHEMGHQWGANHTFNGNVSNCSGGNRSATSAYEPGSGITIMAYAGICGNQDLALHSIDTFHVKSLEVIVAYSQTGGGNACAVTTPTGNTPPTVSVVGGPSFNIPKQTPFTLTATSSDTNGDTVTYDWQEYDLGTSTTAVPNTDSDAVRPVFRPYLPTTGGSRTFPSIEYILNNSNVPPSTYNCNNRATPCLTGELMPQVARTMSFQVVARDNRANGGGINTATATVVVDGTAGPFAVTAPATGTNATGLTNLTVTWNVAGTTAAPINTANVKISLSTDGGLTFPNVLAASTPNDGTEAVLLPNIGTTQARIKVEATNSIYFDITDGNFIITQQKSNRARLFDFDGDAKSDISIFRPTPGEWWYLKSSTGTNAALTFGTSTDVLVPADYTGDGKTDIAFWRPSTGFWFILRSEDLSFYSFPFGTSGDIPAPGDFDGDGKADPTVYRPSAGTWFVNKSTGGTLIQAFGNATDKPIVADYDGDGVSDFAIQRSSASQYWLLRSTAGLIAYTFGGTTDKALPGDYTGDGKADVALWRPSTGEWFVLRSEDSTYYSFPFGLPTDTPVAGDYDGDGKMDAGVFRSSANTWIINRSTAGVVFTAFGSSGDRAVPNAYVR